MKTSVKALNVTKRNSEALKRKENFQKRWDISSDNNDRNDLKNRVLAIITDQLSMTWEYDKRQPAIKNMCKDITIQLGLPSISGIYDSFDSTGLYNYLKKMDLENDDNYHKFVFAIELILNHEYYYYAKVDVNYMAKRIAEAFKLSNANAIIYKNGEGYDIYPINIEFLSEKLVIDVLSWLDDYPTSKNNFSKAIKERRVPDKYRNIVDNLRISLELFLKQFLNNNKSLENQLSVIGEYLSAKGIANEISNMYVKLIDYYSKYNNDKAKHNDKVLDIEIDYMIYLTGSFIRMLIQLDKSINRL